MIAGIVDGIEAVQVVLDIGERVRPAAGTWRAPKHRPAGRITHGQKELISGSIPERVTDRATPQPGEVLAVLQVVDPEFVRSVALYRGRHPAPVVAQVEALKVAALHRQRVGRTARMQRHQPADRRVDAGRVDQCPVRRDIELTLAQRLASHPVQHRDRAVGQALLRVIVCGEECAVDGEVHEVAAVDQRERRPYQQLTGTSIRPRDANAPHRSRLGIQQNRGPVVGAEELTELRDPSSEGTAGDRLGARCSAPCVNPAEPIAVVGDRLRAGCSTSILARRCSPPPAVDEARRRRGRAA